MTNYSTFLELVQKRYSVRKFLDKPVEKNKLDLCMESARLSPSACNSQPWKFVIVENTELKNRLCDGIFSGQYSSNKFVKQAPVLVLVISDKGTFISKVGGFLRDTRFYLIDIGIATEHFVLQATELGLGTCWIGWFNEKKAIEILQLPNTTKIDVIIPVGYPANTLPTKVRKPISEIVTYK